MADSITAGTSAWPNEIVALFRMPPHAHGAVHLDDPLRRVSGNLMQAVDVLGDDGAELSASFEGDERAVASVRARVPRRVLDAAAPGQPPHLGIRHVVVNVRQTLGFGISGPDALGTAKVRNSGLGGNAGARQRDDRARRVNPGRHVPNDVAYLSLVRDGHRINRRRGRQ
jgi:hypothetical protein